MHERYWRQTTDWRATSYSKRAREFTFAKTVVIDQWSQGRWKCYRWRMLVLVHSYISDRYKLCLYFVPFVRHNRIIVWNDPFSMHRITFDAAKCQGGNTFNTFLDKNVLNCAWQWVQPFLMAQVLAVVVCLSVCLSVTSRYSTEKAKRRIMRTTPHYIPWTLVFWC